MRRFAPVLLLMTAACTSSDNSIPSAYVEESTSSSAPSPTTTIEVTTTTEVPTTTTEAPTTTAVTSVEWPILCPGLRHPAHHEPCPVDVTAAPRRTSATTAQTRSTSDELASIRACESGGDYTAVSPSGQYRGAYQFDQPTWESVGGSGDPAAASVAEQDMRAQMLMDSRGRSPWPNC